MNRRPTCSQREPRPRAGGFTIVEIMVVAVIIGLLVGLTTFSMRRVVPREAFIADVRALSERIRECRAQAISRNSEFWLWYDLDTEEYWVSTPYTLEGELARYARAGDAETGAVEDELEYEKRGAVYRTKLAKGVDLSSVTLDGEVYADGRVFVRFTPLGTASEHWLLMKQESTSTVSTIEIQGLTGLISFHDGVWDREPANDNDFN